MLVKSNTKFYYLFPMFLIGLGALIYQIYSVRILFMFFDESIHAVSITISSFLAGLAISSLLMSKLSREGKSDISLVFWLQVCSALYGAFILLPYETVPKLIDSVMLLAEDSSLQQLLKASLMWIYLFMPALFLGGAFPLINGLYVREFKKVSESTGIVYFIDTVGAVAGALIAGFILLPIYGLSVTVITAIVTNIIVCLWFASSRQKVALAIIIPLAILLFAQLQEKEIPVKSIANLDCSSDKNALQDERFGQILFQKSSPYGWITIGEQENDKSLFIDYRGMCGSKNIDNFTERNLGAIAAEHVKEGATALNIGLGCGFTANEIAGRPNIHHLDIVEINPVVLEATGTHFKAENNDVVNSAKVAVILQNGTEYLRTTQKKYDTIVIDIEEISIIYSSPMYTTEYMKIIKSKLADDGVFALWAHYGNEEFSKVLYNTIKSAFPYVEMRATAEGGAVNYYASTHPLNIAESPEEKRLAAFIRSVASEEVNTLDKPILEEKFYLNSIFNLREDQRSKCQK